MSRIFEICCLGEGTKGAQLNKAFKEAVENYLATPA